MIDQRYGILTIQCEYETWEDNHADAELADQVEELLVVLQKSLVYRGSWIFGNHVEQLDEGFLVVIGVTVKGEIKGYHVSLFRSETFEVYRKFNQAILAILCCKFNNGLEGKSETMYITFQLLWKIFVRVKL